MDLRKDLREFHLIVFLYGPKIQAFLFSGFKIGRKWNIKLSDVETLKNKIPEIQHIAPRIQKGNFGSQGAYISNGTRSGTYNIYGDYPILKVVSQKGYL